MSTKGISVAIDLVDKGLFFPITVLDKVVRVHAVEFERSDDASDTVMETRTEGALAAFRVAEDAVVERGAVNLEKQTCTLVLQELAQWGSRAFRTLFNEEAREILSQFLTEREAGEPAYRPTFISSSAPFPWELLYDGADFHHPEEDAFWGLRFAPARVLDVKVDNFRHAAEQSVPSDMLFCVHDQLRLANEHEWPEIEQLVRATAEGRFLLLCQGDEVRVTNGETLLRYLDTARHNMVHFACHCRQMAAGDVLEFSLSGGGAEVDTMISLDVNTFTDAQNGRFARQPLVFLNACQAGGGGDNLRIVFNLPRKFVGRGAGSLIATACPVPDLFAAAFAREFYRLFLGNERMTIGEALRQTRWHFLRECKNPLGLAYGLYTPAHYRLATSPAAARDVL